MESRVILLHRQERPGFPEFEIAYVTISLEDTLHPLHQAWSRKVGSIMQIDGRYFRIFNTQFFGKSNPDLSKYENPVGVELKIQLMTEAEARQSITNQIEREYPHKLYPDVLKVLVEQKLAQLHGEII